LGGTDAKLQIAQERYLQSPTTGSAYLHIEQMSATDFAASLDPEIIDVAGGFDSGLIGLRLVDNEDETVGFAQVGKIQITQLIDGVYSIADVIDVKATGLALSENDQAIKGGWSKDVISGNGGLDWIDGGYGDDILAAGSKVVEGESTNDATLIGAEGNDTLVAVQGVINAFGGEGVNTFAFYGSSADLQVELVAHDFKAGDRIDISQLLTDPFDSNELLELINSADIQGNDRQIDLSDLTAAENDRVLLTIIGGNTPGPMPTTSSFITASADSSTWFNQLDPLVYPISG
jgi:Ca2+-binding RTX toxin-like protein